MILSWSLAIHGGTVSVQFIPEQPAFVVSGFESPSICRRKSLPRIEFILLCILSIILESHSPLLRVVLTLKARCLLFSLYTVRPVRWSIYVCVCLHTYIHICIHTYIHTYIYTCVYIYTCRWVWLYAINWRSHLSSSTAIIIIRDVIVVDDHFGWNFAVLLTPISMARFWVPHTIEQNFIY